MGAPPFNNFDGNKFYLVSFAGLSSGHATGNNPNEDVLNKPDPLCGKLPTLFEGIREYPQHDISRTFTEYQAQIRLQRIGAARDSREMIARPCSCPRNREGPKSPPATLGSSLLPSPCSRSQECTILPSALLEPYKRQVIKCLTPIPPKGRSDHGLGGQRWSKVFKTDAGPTPV